MILKEYIECKRLEIIKELAYNAFRLKDGRVLKITNHPKEIKAAKILIGVESEFWAKIYSVDECENNTYIIVEFVSVLKHREESTYFKIFEKRILYYIIFYYFIYYITFKKVNLRIIDLYKDENIKNLLRRCTEIKLALQKQGVKRPSDYFNESNLGFKNGKIAAFDIRDDNNFFYNFLRNN